MKKYLILFIILFINYTVMAQTNPRQKSVEKPPTQKEMGDMMKEMQKVMDEISPEDKKAMEDMGFKLPSTITIPNFTDEQLQAGADELSRIVPEKDLARIASIPKIPLTKTSLPAYLVATDAKVLLQLKPQSKTKGDEIYKLIKAEHNSAAETGNAAAGLWMMGKVELALYVMGKACIDDPSNTNNLNNYASMLSMSGAEQLSIPILENINRSFPQNSTILNNIGQAWFGLGDIDKSENYLDSTIRIYAYHPQANFTKSFIEESKGNTEAAVQAAKRSIKNGYSSEKENRLYKLGYDLDSKDLNWDKPLPQDPLGLEKFNWPAFPKSVNSSIPLEQEWDAFREACAKEDDILESKQEQLEDAWATISEARRHQLIEASRTGQNGSLFPPLANKAFKKLKYLIDDTDGRLSFSIQQKTTAITAAIDDVEKLSKELSDKTRKLDEIYLQQFGEGKANPFEAACNDYNGVTSNFLNSANTLLEQTQKDYLNALRRYLNDQVYYDQYTKWPEQFELAKVIAKRKWLGAINQKVMFKDPSGYCQKKEEIKPGKGKIQDFDDVNCTYHSVLKLPVGSITVDCSRVTSSLDLKFIKLGLKQNMEKETFGDQFMSGSIEIGAGTSAGFSSGVLKAEAAIGGAIAVEIDRTGITDVILKGAASVSVGTDEIGPGNKKSGVNSGFETKDGEASDVGVIQDLQVEVGVKGQISLVSGKSSVESTGLLKRVLKK